MGQGFHSLNITVTFGYAMLLMEIEDINLN